MSLYLYWLVSFGRVLAQIGLIQGHIGLSISSNVW